MSASALEGEDLDNVRLVRMEDVQPSREGRIEIFETCIIDHIEYDNECVIGDDQTNVGGIVSIQTDETEQSASEFIVPEILEVPVYYFQENEKLDVIPHTPDRWPTLEILPGGVIKPADKADNQNSRKSRVTLNSEMIYACAKCSQTFKFLYCLVKHVRWHENEQKVKKSNIADLILSKNRKKQDKQANLNTGTKKVVITKMVTKRKKANQRTKRLKT
ncbi:uncharacterized protein LOC101739492 isoform X1 [Bombyx mori]|uniref:C2H2-type domain-containing protein n=1 Tax=Bombyx mori TaxID=7091 RepID=A0A8R2M7P4_BOMMO|nr:uncharacterized protein LOC101739492 isoform X3 [Bombyx mori]